MNSKISNLNSATTLTDADVLPIVNGAETKKVTISLLKSQIPVNADWNATTGKAQILNKPTIPTQTNQLTNNGADGVNPFITALDIPTAGQASTLVREVKNMTGATLTKGTVVYISGANGNKALVSKALATTDALSSRTFGMLQSDILNNGLGNCVIIGDITGLNTSSFTEGDQLYLSGVTAGTYTASKILAPTHLVYVGKVTRSHPTLGQIEVGIQNGYELEEIHDVQIITPTNNQGLFYEIATDLWKNKSIATVLGFTPANDSNVVHKTGVETVGGAKTFSNSIVTDSDGSKPSILVNVDQINGQAGVHINTFEIGSGNALEVDYTNTDLITTRAFQVDVTGNVTTSSIVVTQQTANTIASFGASKNIVSLPVGTYPSLTELARLKGVTSSVQTQIDGIGGTWVDYSATSTIIGWTTFTQKTIRYIVIGKTLIIDYFISGTSNVVTTSFTIPQTSATVTGMIWANNNQVQNNAVNYVGYGNISSNSSTITFGYYPTSSTITSNWTASGTKLIRGMITIEIA